jgi:hypothetical protein
MEKLETLEDYIKRLHRDEKAQCGKFRICKTTKKLYQVGYGSLKYGKNYKQIPGQIIGSFYAFVGGYFFRNLENGKILQIQPFKEDNNIKNHQNNWMIIQP